MSEISIDVKEKLDKGLISKNEAEIMSQFDSIDAKNQILFECRTIAKAYRKCVASYYKGYVKNAIIKNVTEEMKKTKEKGFSSVKYTDEAIENETLEWMKLIEIPEPLKSEGERCPAHIREVEKEWKNMIKRWIKEAVKKGIEKYMVRERYSIN